MPAESILSGNDKLNLPVPGFGDVTVKGVSLAPATSSGHQVCRWATKGCIAACVGHSSGRRVQKAPRERAKRLTRWLYADTPGFLNRLNAEIAREQAKADRERRRFYVRLNTFSDLNWTAREEPESDEAFGVIEQHPETLFYDYTKSFERARSYALGLLPRNYSVTYSVNEDSDPDQVNWLLRRGVNVSVVVDVEYVIGKYARKGEIPDRWTIGDRTWLTVDGDIHDVRRPETDGIGRVIVLRLKGKNTAKEHARDKGFALPVLN